MRTILCVSLVVSSMLGGGGGPTAEESPVGALAIDERRGDQWDWAVNYETANAAQSAALRECGAGCSVVLTFGRCGAYAADQDTDSTTVGWAEAYNSASSAQQAALSRCSARGGGSGCIARVWGCNGPVVEEALGLDQASRREIQLRFRAEGFDPGGADGMFSPLTRAAIRGWQTPRGGQATGYLDGPAAEALRSAGTSGPAVAAVAAPATTSVQPTGVPPAATTEQENLFWQSIMNSTNAAEFEAYLAQFPNGVFSALARARLVALQSPAGAGAVAGTRVGGAGSPASGARAPAGSNRPGGAATASGSVAGDARPVPGEVFRDCADCPEMVVLRSGRLALGRYEVTVVEYRAFASATGGGASDCFGSSWRGLSFPQTDRHPVTCVSWDDAQEYVSWLSRTTGATYRLPTDEEWGRAAAGTPEGSGCGSDPSQFGTCPVGSYSANGAGLWDMVGNLSEWTADCFEGDCGRRVLRGSSWDTFAADLRPDARFWNRAGLRFDCFGFRVARTFD